MTELVEKNSQRSAPLPITIALRPDRPRSEVMKDPDFQPILSQRPPLDFAWAFGAIRGNVPAESLLHEMRFRAVGPKAEACVQTYNGLMVLADGTVIGCSCVAAMDAQADLTFGNILTTSLLDIWQGEHERRLRASFDDGSLNGSCASCGVYRKPRPLSNLRRTATCSIEPPEGCGSNDAPIRQTPRTSSRRLAKD